MHVTCQGMSHYSLVSPALFYREPHEALRPPQVRAAGEVAGGLARLLDSSRLFDAVLCAQGGEEVAVHRAVLAAQSDVFASMFEADFRERATGRVQIGDHRAAVVRKMVG